MTILIGLLLFRWQSARRQKRAGDKTEIRRFRFPFYLEAVTHLSRAAIFRHMMTRDRQSFITQFFLFAAIARLSRSCDFAFSHSRHPRRFCSFAFVLCSSFFPEPVSNQFYSPSIPPLFCTSDFDFRLSSTKAIFDSAFLPSGFG